VLVFSAYLCVPLRLGGKCFYNFMPNAEAQRYAEFAEKDHTTN